MSIFFPLIFLTKLYEIGIHFFILLFLYLVRVIKIGKVNWKALLVSVLAFLTTLLSILNGQDVFRAFLYAIKTSAMIGILFISLPNIRYLKISYHHSMLGSFPVPEYQYQFLLFHPRQLRMELMIYLQ